MMHQVIEDRSRRNDPLVNGLFIPQKELRAVMAAATATVPTILPPPTQSDAAPVVVDFHNGSIQSLKAGFGFIRPASGGPTIFFFHAEVTNAGFNEVHEGDKVRYRHGKNDRGACAVEF
jgi:cold shock CspA family protein